MNSRLVSDRAIEAKASHIGCPPGEIEMQQLAEPRLSIGGAEARQPLEGSALYRIKGSDGLV